MEKISSKIIEEDVLVRIFVDEKEKLHGKPVYEAILLKAKEIGLAGATVTRCVMGFGADKRMRSAKILDLSDNLPFVVEIVDQEENIERFIPFLDENLKDGFITMEKVHVIKYRHKKD